MTDVFSQEEQALVLYTFLSDFLNTVCYKQLNLIEVARKRKCDNNGDSSSNKKRAHKTHSFETKLNILKHIDNGEGHGEISRLLGLSNFTVSTIVKKWS
jgi:DNA-binding NarL/FixJ family response regulator